MKVLILVPVWGRSEVTEIFSKHLWAILPENYQVLAILSQDDPNYTQNHVECALSGFKTCIYQNKPLGRKLNAGIELAITYEWDYLMNLGSDDLIHPAIFNLYRLYLEQNIPFFGLDKVYFYDRRGGKLAISKEYYWGAGRMIHRDLILNLRSRGISLYNDKFGKGLDCNSMDVIQEKLGVKYEQIPTNDFPFIVDIKTNENLNDYLMLSRFYDEVDPELLKRYYPKQITDLLYG